MHADKKITGQPPCTLFLNIQSAFVITRMAVLHIVSKLSITGQRHSCSNGSWFRPFPISRTPLNTVQCALSCPCISTHLFFTYMTTRGQYLIPHVQTGNQGNSETLPWAESLRLSTVCHVLHHSSVASRMQNEGGACKAERRFTKWNHVLQKKVARP